ncbi:hypothetical protein HFU84_08550 [Acidithiobacillus sp. CV18-2]|uniref:Uncharacterized protein n=1 Tax=Igneacidithiobacillus copahuensis TaxID=2724909 RepID=A0AAE2YR32_9PROT|nr:hypothetical protein [Igneacidithiobacillus copahuensis]MBU2755234.1 hypothetical protein [Acidithiobacillus sp. CV18-3]MBU2756941.1 hypothetical protein [Acidithiobacillus sp. BN09-2]MBU2777552.1 hypothetical protein [Acidithiobacillus sp. CV18-2]MBU2796667.1 hypothetical protein [Acidithiobacillus sp. VAN18-2]MBU2799652.1 hypothetical protein [Acidithiobacillus sp. VAN18-4]
MQWPKECAQWWKNCNAQAGEELQGGILTYQEMEATKVDALIETVFQLLPAQENDSPSGQWGASLSATAHDVAMALQSDRDWYRLVIRLPMSVSLPLLSRVPLTDFSVTQQLSPDEQQSLEWLGRIHLMLNLYYRKPPTMSVASFRP